MTLEHRRSLPQAYHVGYHARMNTRSQTTIRYAA
jgi:hypothetical protein